jgi:hypothetical protein
MGSETGDQVNVASQLAQLTQQIRGLVDTTNDIKTSLKDVASLDRAVGSLILRHEQAHKEITLQWNRVDALKEDVEMVDRKHDEWINKARGAYWTFMLLGGLAQAAIVTAIGWTFVNVKTNNEEVMLLK